MEPQKQSENAELVQQPDVTLDAENEQVVASTSSEDVNEVAQPATDESVAQKADEQEIPTVWTKEGVIEALLQTVADVTESSRKKVNQFKAIFDNLRKPEIEAEKAAFVAAGNDEAAFVATPDSLEEKLKEIIAEYKEKRAAQIAAEEAERAENLKKKHAVLDSMREIIADQDNINSHYQQFQQLQSDFKAIGAVPPEYEKEVWKEFKELTENFYDVLKINKELRDLDFRKNLQAKEQLIAQAEEADKDNDVIAAFKTLQHLHIQWREIGPTAPEIREVIWTKFKELSTSINKKHQEYFEKRKAEEKVNEEGKNALCEKIEAIDLNELKTYVAWGDATEEIKKLQEEWKTFGFAAKKVNNELFARFRATCDKFFEKKAEFFQTMKDESAENLRKKTELCEKAEALQDSTEWAKTTKELVALQNEWKTIGAVARKHSDAIWKRFVTACDTFFERKAKQNADQRQEQNANLETKRGIVANLEALAEEAGENLMEKARELMKQWRETGHVPFKEKDKLHDAYEAAVDKIHAKARRQDHRRNSNRNDVKLDLYQLQRRYDIKLNELKTYENNLLFFTAKSKQGNSILKNLEINIKKIKTDLEILKEKIAQAKEEEAKKGE